MNTIIQKAKNANRKHPLSDIPEGNSFVEDIQILQSDMKHFINMNRHVIRKRLNWIEIRWKMKIIMIILQDGTVMISSRKVN